MMEDNKWIEYTRIVAASLNQARELFEKHDLLYQGYLSSFLFIKNAFDNNPTDNNMLDKFLESKEPTSQQSFDIVIKANVYVFKALFFCIKAFNISKAKESRINLVIDNNSFLSICVLLTTSDPLSTDLFFRLCNLGSIVETLMPLDEYYKTKIKSEKDSGIKRLIDMINQRTNK